MADLSVNQARFLQWLLDPRSSTKDEPEGKGSQTKLAQRMGISPSSLTKWKRDPAFLSEWEKKHQSITGGIERYSEMLSELYAIGMGRRPGTRPADQRSALMNYFELVDRYSPKRTLEIKDPALAEIEDEALAAVLRRRLTVIEGGKAPRKRASGKR